MATLRNFEMRLRQSDDQTVIDWFVALTREHVEAYRRSYECPVGSGTEAYYRDLAREISAELDVCDQVMTDRGIRSPYETDPT